MAQPVPELPISEKYPLWLKESNQRCKLLMDTTFDKKLWTPLASPQQMPGLKISQKTDGMNISIKFNNYFDLIKVSNIENLIF